MRPHRPGPRISLWIFRGLALVHVAVVLLQPVLAGRYLGGDFDALGLHATVAGIVMLTGVTQIGGAVALFAGGGVGWPVVATVVVSTAEVMQIGMGYARVLAVHIPLGVTIVTTSVLLAVWVWRPAAARPRRWLVRRKSSGAVGAAEAAQAAGAAS